jgi:hypothetical protein
MDEKHVNRKMNVVFALIIGLTVGVPCYLLAEGLVPPNVASATDHDILLADRLGFIYPAIVAIWLGWLQRSWQRAFFGVCVGIGIGIIYMWLCASRDFMAIMVGFPCLLGCVFAAVVGSNRSPWAKGLGVRIGKGLLAGLVLGFVYMVVLNVVGAMIDVPSEPPEAFTKGYISMMWFAGPVALGAASALFFVLIRWAVGLNKIRVVTFEDVEGKTEKPDEVSRHNS